MPKLVRAYASQAMQSCEECGHDIKAIYIVELDTGAQKRVGSECVKQYLAADAVLFKRYMDAAAREWRKAEPKPAEGEERADYITRRVAEKVNARAAWQEWRSLSGMQWAAMITQRLKAKGIKDPSEGMSYHRSTCPRNNFLKCARCDSYEADKAAYGVAWKAEREAHIREIEERHGANRFDFFKPVWRV